MPVVRGNQIRKQILLISTAALILLGVFSFLFIAYPLFDQLEDAENNNIVHAAETRSLALQQWHRGLGELARQVASRSAIRNRLEAFSEGQISLQALQTFTTPKLADAVNSTEQIFGILRTTAEGEIVTRYGLQVPENSLRFSRSFAQAPAVSTPIQQGEAFLIAVKSPIVGSSKQLLGYDLLTFTLDDVATIIDNREGLGNNSSILLFYQTDKLHFPFAMDEPPWQQELNRLLNQAALSQPGEQRIFEGETIVVGRSPLIDQFWGLLVVQEKDELYAGIRQQLTLSLLTGLVLAIAISAILLRTIAPLTNRFLLMQEELETRIQQKTSELEQANTQLQHLSMTDDLTQVHNRRKLSEVLQQEILRAKRYNSPLSVMMIDIDHFKRVNDQYGHATGDHVLSVIADNLTRRVRATDTVGRWGGEEFLMILPQTTAAEAAQLAEELRMAIAEVDFKETDSQTCSFGVTSLIPQETTAHLIARVDQALYQAKDAGRNCVKTL